MTRNSYCDPNGDQETQLNSYAALSPYVMAYLLCRRVNDARARAWTNAKSRMEEGEAGREQAALYYLRWLDLDTCYRQLRMVLTRLEGFRSANEIDAQVMARATLDDVEIDWEQVHKGRKAG